MLECLRDWSINALALSNDHSWDLGSIVFHSKTEPGYYPAEVWESTVADCRFEDGKLRAMKLVSTIAGAAAARGAPDGYAVLLTALSVSGLAPWIYKVPNYDAVNDFAAVAKLAEVPNVLYVKGDSRFKSVGEFLQFARANPGKADLSVVGLGSSNHLAGVLIERAAGASFTYVPFKSGAESMQSVLAGNTDIAVSNISTVITQFKSGTLRALAATGRMRAEQLPELPTLREARLADLDVTAWYGLLVPARTLRAIVDRLGAVVGEILGESEVVERYRRLGAEVAYMRPAEFDA